MAETWSPHWAPHVVGRIGDREVDEDGNLVGVRYEAECEGCGAKWGPATCESGRPRERVARFALSHVECKVKR